MQCDSRYCRQHISRYPQIIPPFCLDKLFRRLNNYFFTLPGAGEVLPLSRVTMVMRKEGGL